MATSINQWLHIVCGMNVKLDNWLGNETYMYCSTVVALYENGGHKTGTSYLIIQIKITAFQ